jgi:serine/threonine protein phosphatase PrpC
MGARALGDLPAALIEAAIAHGGADNVTAVVVGVNGMLDDDTHVGGA